MTIVPVPQRLVILPVILPTLGSPLLSASFSRHDFLVFIVTPAMLSALNDFR